MVFEWCPIADSKTLSRFVYLHFGILTSYITSFLTKTTPKSFIHNDPKCYDLDLI